MLFLIISFLVLADLLALITIGYVLFDVAKEIRADAKEEATKEVVKAE